MPVCIAALSTGKHTQSYMPMDPRASTMKTGGDEIPTTLRLQPAPVSLDMGAEAPRYLVTPSYKPANDQPRLPDVVPGNWEALAAIYPIATQVFSSTQSNEFIKRIRLSLRALFHLGTWKHWHGFLESSPFGRIAAFYPRIYEKPFRPYLHKSLDSRERCRLLLQHYGFLARHAPVELVDALLANQPFLLNEHSLGELEQPLVVNLTYAKHMQQEGELTLSVGPLASLDSFQQHAWIASLTFVLRRGADGWEIAVGGVQGGHAETGKEDAKTATRVFHGLRPKHLLIHVLREIADCWGIERIYGISNAAHALTRKRYRGRITIKSSYDELWQEAGGQLDGHGYYLLPVHQARRGMESIPSRKRSQYQRRYRLLDALGAEIRAKLAPR